MSRLLAIGGLDAISTITKLDDLRQYLDVLKKQIDSMAEDYSKKMDAEVKAIESAHEKDEYYDIHLDEYWQYTETFPRIFMNSFLIITYSLLETQTHGVAKRIRKRFHEIFDVDEIRGGGNLDAAILFIKKLTNVDAKQFSSWNAIKDAQRLRNIIVHANGYIAPDSQQDKELAQKYNVLDQSMIDEVGTSISTISITYDYCLAVLDTLDSFFSDLFEQIKRASHP